MTKEQEEIQRVETSTKKEEAEPILEEDHTIEDTTEEATTDKEVFQETWGLCQEKGVSHQMREIEEEQKEEDLMKEEVLQETVINNTHV